MKKIDCKDAGAAKDLTSSLEGKLAASSSDMINCDLSAATCQRVCTSIVRPLGKIEEFCSDDTWKGHFKKAFEFALSFFNGPNSDKVRTSFSDCVAGKLKNDKPAVKWDAYKPNKDSIFKKKEYKLDYENTNDAAPSKAGPANSGSSKGSSSAQASGDKTTKDTPVA